MKPDGTYSDMFILDGPTGVGWCVDADFNISATRLTLQHARTAFEFYYSRRSSKIHASYARRLCQRVRDQVKGVYSDESVELCKLTRKTYYSGTPDMAGVVQLHREALAYLGELSCQIKRALDNGCIMHGFVQDIRETCPVALKDMLDSWGIPGTNQPNPYGEYAPLMLSLNSTIASMWLRQEDEQAATITKKLQEGDITIRNS
jgi:hypothetical protein